MTKALDGKVVLVTGAGGGIGRDIALMAASEGAAVVVNDLGASLKGTGQTETAAQKVVEEIKAAGGDAIADGGSVTDPDAARAMIEAGVKEFGRIDAVVNNAGILRDGFFHKMTYEDFDAVVKVHLYGSFNTSRAAADYFREQEGGALVHMTSTSGLIGNFAQANYSAAKLGIAAFSKSVALDLQALERALELHRALRLEPDDLVDQDRHGRAKSAGRKDQRNDTGQGGAHGLFPDERPRGGRDGADLRCAQERDLPVQPAPSGALRPFR